MQQLIVRLSYKCLRKVIQFDLQLILDSRAAVFKWTEIHRPSRHLSAQS